MPWLTSFTFITMTVFFLLFSLASYFVRFYQISKDLQIKAHGNEGIKDSSFDYYDKSRPFYYAMKYVFIINAIYTVPTNTIFTSEFFEDLDQFKPFFKPRGKNLSRRSLLLSRSIMLVLSFLMAFASDNLTIILGLGGGLFCPLLSYIFPIMWIWWFEKNRGIKKNFMTIFFDWQTIIFGLIVTVFANYYGFKEIFDGGDKN